MAKDDGNGQKPRSPAATVEVMIDVLAVVVGLLVLSDTVVGEPATTPLAMMAVSVHPGQCALEVAIGHVMPNGKTVRGQGPAIVQIMSRLDSTVTDGLDQDVVGFGAHDLPCVVR